MAVELKVPEMGESVVEVELGDWLKQEGDFAERDEPLVVIESDKVTVELPAPVSGVIKKILRGKGAVVKVGEVIGEMEPAERPAAGEPEGATASSAAAGAPSAATAAPGPPRR
ncbi:MAG: hypothetical protein D6718_03105 [Acidobacteria bacterium]|nr:MAG: hypothetical protein D6718_03105 [Acidobacteriota bacterium]